MVASPDPLNIVRVYQVGGSVRDGLLGIKSKDIDFAVEAESYEVMREWIKGRGTIFLEAPEFWTIRAHVKGKQPADFVLCRRDGKYSDGRRPDSVEPGTLLEDLARRDFTINAMAIDEDGNLIDPYNGQTDLANRVLRCVGESRDRFQEDALRMLRAIRFSITKSLSISPAVDNALRDQDLIDSLQTNISADRKRDELHRCFSFDTIATLNTLHDYRGIRDACLNTCTGIWLMPTQQNAK